MDFPKPPQNARRRGWCGVALLVVLVALPAPAPARACDRFRPEEVEKKTAWGVDWRTSLDAVIAANAKATHPHPIFLMRVLGDLEGDM